MDLGLQQELYEVAKKFPAATLHESYDRRGALPSEIKPISGEFTLYGPAFTVLSPPKDNLWLHRAIYEAKPGDVLVVETGGYYEAGYWGEIMAFAAMTRKIAGLIIDGCVRDCKQITKMGFPTFSRGLCIQGTGKDEQAYGHLNKPIRIGEIYISPGDLVAGDADGVVVIAKEHIEMVLQKSQQREDKEAEILKQLSAGKSTLEVYNF